MLDGCPAEPSGSEEPSPAPSWRGSRVSCHTALWLRGEPLREPPHPLVISLHPSGGSHETSRRRRAPPSPWPQDPRLLTSLTVAWPTTNSLVAGEHPPFWNLLPPLALSPPVLNTCLPGVPGKRARFSPRLASAPGPGSQGAGPVRPVSCFLLGQNCPSRCLLISCNLAL